jgi:hypothetical protein
MFILLSLLHCLILLFLFSSTFLPLPFSSYSSSLSSNFFLLLHLKSDSSVDYNPECAVCWFDITSV